MEKSWSSWVAVNREFEMEPPGAALGNNKRVPVAFKVSVPKSRSRSNTSARDAATTTCAKGGRDPDSALIRPNALSLFRF